MRALNHARDHRLRPGRAFRHLAADPARTRLLHRGNPGRGSHFPIISGKDTALLKARVAGLSFEDIHGTNT